MFNLFAKKNISGMSLTETTLAASLLSIVVGAMVVLLNLGMKEINSNTQKAQEEFRAYTALKQFSQNLEMASYRRVAPNNEWLEFGRIDNKLSLRLNQVVWELKDKKSIDPEGPKISYYVRFQPATGAAAAKYGDTVRENSIMLRGRRIERDLNRDGDFSDTYQVGFIESAQGDEKETNFANLTWRRVSQMPALRLTVDGNKQSNFQRMFQLSFENRVLDINIIFYNFDKRIAVPMVKSVQSRNTQ